MTGAALRTRIRALYFSRQWTKRDVAQELGLAYSTVCHALATESASKPVHSALAPDASVVSDLGQRAHKGEHR